MFGFIGKYLISKKKSALFYLIEIIEFYKKNGLTFFYFLKKFTLFILNKKVLNLLLKKIQHSLAMILVYLKKKSGLRFLKKEYHKETIILINSCNLYIFF